MAFVMPFLPLIGGALGAGASIYAQSQSAKAAQSAAEYNNALAEQEARNKEAQTTEAIRRERAANEAKLGEIRARLAAGSGTVTTEGAPLMLLGESAGRMELGIADAARTASIQAAALRSQGAMGLWEADQASNAAIYGMAATGLKAAGSIYSDYQRGEALGLYAPRAKIVP